MPFANPFIGCSRCGRQAVWRRRGRNVPCGCDAPYESVCLTWAPASGCRCHRILDYPEHLFGTDDPKPVVLPDWVRHLRRRA